MYIRRGSDGLDDSENNFLDDDPDDNSDDNSDDN
jgi:hypothetical protein